MSEELDKEIEYLENYIELQEMRFGKEVDVSFIIDGETEILKYSISGDNLTVTTEDGETITFYRPQSSWISFLFLGLILIWKSINPTN